jgi:hypothetical protein
MDKKKFQLIKDLVSKSKTPHWTCIFAALKLLHPRPIETDCENLNKVLVWYGPKGDAEVLKDLRKSRHKLKCP